MSQSPLSGAPPRKPRRVCGREAGFTLMELVVVTAILAILAATALPLAHYTAKRTRELDLRQGLREMRNAIDEYKRYSDAGLIPVELGSDGYPKNLQVLVDGVKLVGKVDQRVKFLRRIPVDPMTGEAKWGLRSYQDDPDSTTWGGEDVYDVYSLSSGTGLNGIKYSKW